MKQILTDKERTTLQGMSGYWREVWQREDQAILVQEVQDVYRILGVRILDIVSEYVNRKESPDAKS